MCTVSVLSGRHVDGRPWVRLACNRDELLTRPVALLPQCRKVGDTSAILPIDPASGGTWIAVTSAGLAFALLNVNRGASVVSVGLRSRGLIIPKLLAALDLRQAMQSAARMDATQLAPFRLLVLDDRAIAEFLWTGAGDLQARCDSLPAVMFFTSSGLGDQLVEQPRREVFEKSLVQQQPTPERQDALHKHRWPDRPALSICMNRSDARTVSFTTIEIEPAQVRLDYRARFANRFAKTWSQRLPRLKLDAA